MIDEYLALLGVPRRAPSLDHLFELHRAHVSRVPYTNVQIMRGAPASIDPLDAAGKHETHAESASDFAAAYAAVRLSNVDDQYEGALATHEQWLASL